MKSGPVLCQSSEKRKQERKEERFLKMNIIDFVLYFKIVFFLPSQFTTLTKVHGMLEVIFGGKSNGNHHFVSEEATGVGFL